LFLMNILQLFFVMNFYWVKILQIDAYVVKPNIITTCSPASNFGYRAVMELFLKEKKQFFIRIKISQTHVIQ